MQKYFKNIIAITLIISFVVPLPYLATKQAYAQTQGGYTPLGSSAGGTGIGGYLSGIAPAITQLPLCKGKLGTTIKTLFRKSGAEDAVSSVIDIDADQAEQDAINTYNKKAELAQEQAQERADAIKTYDPIVQKIVNRIDITTANTQKTTKELEANDTCLKSIGRMVTKLMLQKITVSTVAWIQTGFEGSPTFIQNPKSFFKDIAKNEILQFGAEINNQTLYPFGKAFMIAQANAFNTHFAQNAQYSLNELIQNTTPEYSGATFKADFSAGGWNAWTAMTSVPANNPLGFQLMASNELSKRLEGTYKSEAVEIREALAQANGYLGDQRCADPEGLTREENNTLLEAGLIEETCKRWEYVTPGKMISDKATTALGYDSNNLLKSDDLNDAMAAILDALLSRFSSDLMNEGFADFSNQGSDGSYILNIDGLLTGPDSQIEQDFTRFQLGSQWLKDHPNFNIRTDITQALIDEQRIYKIKLEEQSTVLKDLNKTIYQLDYCIPGPHPGWEQDSREVLSAVNNSIVSKTAADMKNISKEQILGLVNTATQVGAMVAGAVIGASLGSVVPILGTAIGAAAGVVIGLIVNFLINTLSGDTNEEKLTLYYGSIVAGFTGIPVDVEGEGSSNLRNKQEITNAFDTMLSRYIKLIHKYYTPEYLPPVAKDAAKEFRKTIGYNEIIKDNNDKIILLNSIIKRLTAVKDGIQLLNAQYPGGSTGTAANQNAYEVALENFKGEFSRLTQNMVTGDDIASVDNLTKQARDEIKYVYDDLLTGDYGCEQDLRNNYRLTPGNPTRTWLLRGTARAEYPVELWYDYNDFAPNEQLPTPAQIQGNLKLYTQKTNVSNQMPNLFTMPGVNITEQDQIKAINEMKFGPGFLSAVWYNANSGNTNAHPSYDIPGQNTSNGNGICGKYLAGIITNAELDGIMLDCMRVTDLFRQINITERTPTVGRKQWPGGGQYNNTNEQKDISFEQMIGVY